MQIYRLDPPVDAAQRLDDLLAAPKFLPESDFYTGVADPTAREAAEATVNAAIIAVLQLLNSNAENATVLKVFQHALLRMKLSDTEDRECAARYFEQIMDCINLDSSEGLLNTFVYGFDVSALIS